MITETDRNGSTASEPHPWVLITYMKKIAVGTLQNTLMLCQAGPRYDVAQWAWLRSDPH